MKQARNQMDGLSLHYYTVAGWSGSKGSATDFTPEDYYWTMGKCLDIENCIKEHSAVMDKYDPKKRVALMVDECREPTRDFCISRTPCVMLSWQPFR